MAGIYIPGMQSPKDCKSCDMFINCDACDGLPCNCAVLGSTGLYAHEIPDGFRLEKCHIIPVTDHGRLGDLDALKEIILDYIEEYSWLEENGMHNLKWCAMKEVEAVIDAAPTIIPADKKEEK